MIKTWGLFPLFVKRSADIAFSLIAIVILLPLMLIISLLILITSSRPVFYRQERIGKNQKPFQLYKFRTMINESEENGPQLAQEDDDRITRVGHFLRKWRLDELPQFFNVLIGDMSIVGPRPERAFYAAQLISRNNEYLSLYKVKPGITSSGMVEYGYASSIEEMEERLPFDLAYMRNLSLLQDFKILLKTIFVLVNGNGK